MLYNSESFLDKSPKNPAMRKLYISDLVQKGLLQQHLLNRLQKPDLQTAFKNSWANVHFREFLERQPEWIDSWKVLKNVGLGHLAEEKHYLKLIGFALAQNGYNSLYIEQFLRESPHPQGVIDQYFTLLNEQAALSNPIHEMEYIGYRQTAFGTPPKDRIAWKYALVGAIPHRKRQFSIQAIRGGWDCYTHLKLENGAILDGYNPAMHGKPALLITRWAVHLKDVKLELFQKAINQLKSKIPIGIKIVSSRYLNLNGKIVDGQRILQLPLGNQDYEHIQNYIDISNQQGFKVNFQKEKLYA
ncbi:MAG: hypothetical protein ACPGJS_06310 [Flammeovirgaceae bacterium]